MLTKDQFQRAIRRAFGRRTRGEYAAKMGMTYSLFDSAFYYGKVKECDEKRLRSILGSRFLLGDEATRPMIIGLNDYHSPSAFKPYWPIGASLGHAMWYMLYEALEMSKAEYIRSFDRHVLISIPKQHSATKKEALWRAFAYAKGHELRPHLANRTAMLLDPELMRMLGLPHTEKYLAWHIEPDGFKWCRAPYRPPLGVWKGDDTNRRVKERLVEIYMEWLSMP